MKNKFIQSVLTDSIVLKILSGIGDAVSIQDVNMTVLFQNDAHKDLLGSHLGKHCYKGFFNRDAACEACPLIMNIQNGKSHPVVQSRTTDHGVIYMELTPSPIRDDDGKINVYVEIVRNVTKGQNAFGEKKIFSGIIQICASCKRIRSGSGCWDEIETYISGHTDALFSHGMCPKCAKRMYPEYIKG